MWFAGVAATLSVVLIVAYYVPGLDDSTDATAEVLLLSLPAALMAFPFLLFALLIRVKIVAIVTGALMLWGLGAAAFELYGETYIHPALLVFVGTFWNNW